MNYPLSDLERVILKALLVTYRQQPGLFLDLRSLLPSHHPQELDEAAADLNDQQWVECVAEEAHLLCRLTDQGFAALRTMGMPVGFWAMHQKWSTAALVVLVALFLGIGAAQIVPLSALMGDLTGESIRPKTTVLLTEWLEQQEQEDASHYTFSLLEKVGDLTTYLVECRSEFQSVCKYTIVFIEVDEEKGVINNVELPTEEHN